MGNPADDRASDDPLRQVVDLINRRSGRYRNLVVLVVAIGFAAPVAALALWDWRALLGWLLVPPLTGLFLFLDARAVARWRSDLLDGWIAGTLDLDALREGLTSIKLLPALTIAGMVDPLPTRARLQCFPDPKPHTREALAATVRAIDGVLVLRTAIATLAATATLALVAVAAITGSWWPIVGLPLTISLSRASRRIGSRPPRHWVRQVATLRDRGLDADVFAELAGRLAWEPLPPAASEKWRRSAREKSAERR